MNQPHPDKEPSDSPDGMPDGIPAPPMPKPDIVDPAEQEATYGTEDKVRKRERNRRHPTDKYPPVKNSKTGCRSCFGCLGAFFLLTVVVLGAIAYLMAAYGPLKPLTNDHVFSYLGPEKSIITEAPDVPTYFVGGEIVYNAPLTEVPIALAGTTVTVSGDFYEEVTLTGEKVVGKSTARFAKDLTIFAPLFVDEGILLKGERKGRVMETTP